MPHGKVDRPAAGRKYPRMGKEKCPLSKRTVKKYKVFLGQQLCAAGRFLCSETEFMLLHWSLMRGSVYLYCGENISNSR